MNDLSLQMDFQFHFCSKSNNIRLWGQFKFLSMNFFTKLQHQLLFNKGSSNNYSENLLKMVKLHKHQCFIQIKDFPAYFKTNLEVGGSSFQNKFLYIKRSLLLILMEFKTVSFEVKLEESEKQSSIVLPKPKRKRRKIVESDLSGQEEPYEPDFNQYKKIGLPVDMKRVTTGSWSIEQNKIYLNFLEVYYDDFQNESNRRRTTVFNRLSKALKKRTPDQCRSHHQKLQNRFNNELDKIIEFVKQKMKIDGQQDDTKLKLLRTTACCTAACSGAITTGLITEEPTYFTVDFSTLVCW